MAKTDTEQVRRQISDLWRETFGEQPSIVADAETMLKVLVSCLEDVGPWVINSPADVQPADEKAASIPQAQRRRA